MQRHYILQQSMQTSSTKNLDSLTSLGSHRALASLTVTIAARPVRFDSWTMTRPRENICSSAVPPSHASQGLLTKHLERRGKHAQRLKCRREDQHAMMEF